jgi:hypothetical protein
MVNQSCRWLRMSGSGAASIWNDWRCSRMGLRMVDDVLQLIAEEACFP